MSAASDGSSPGQEIDRVVDEREAARFLAERFGSIEQVEQLGGGDWSRAYGFRHNGAGYVARFGAFEEDFAKDRLAAAFASPALPVPRVVEMGEAFGGFYCISERLYGAFLDGLDEAGLRRAPPSLWRAPDRARLSD